MQSFWHPTDLCYFTVPRGVYFEIYITPSIFISFFWFTPIQNQLFVALYMLDRLFAHMHTHFLLQFCCSISHYCSIFRLSTPLSKYENCFPVFFQRQNILQYFFFFLPLVILYFSKVKGRNICVYYQETIFLFLKLKKYTRERCQKFYQVQIYIPFRLHLSKYSQLLWKLLKQGSNFITCELQTEC